MGNATHACGIQQRIEIRPYKILATLKIGWSLL